MNKLINFLIPLFVELISKPISRILTRKMTSKPSKISNELKKTKFYKNTILSIEKEELFAKKTGIRTNSNSIKYYEKLKNRLGRDYTLKEINLTSKFQIMRDNEIEINVDQVSRNLSKACLLLSFSSYLLGFILFFYFKKMGTEIYLDVLSLVVFPLIGYYILILIRPTFVAIGMQRRLEQISLNN